MSFDPFSYIIIGLSTLYQAYRGKKQKKALQEKAAIQEIQVSGSGNPISIHYGYVRTQGLRTYATIGNRLDLREKALSQKFPSSNRLRSGSGSKNEYLLTQTVIGAGTINSVRFMDIDEIAINDEKFENFIHIEIANNTGLANTTASAFTNERSVTDTYDGLCYSTNVFKLDTEEPQFSGIPSTYFYLEGLTLRSIIHEDDVFSISTIRTFTNNSVLVLLDYLLSEDYGAGWSVDDIDLGSFYDSFQIANTVVQEAAISRKYLSSGARRSLRKYEFNGSISTDTSFNTVIETILDTMTGSEFFRGVDGKWKLVVPDSDTSLAIQSRGTYDEDDLISNIIIQYPDLDVRLNQQTIKYINESRDYSNDSVTEPKTGSTTRDAYLEEDQNLGLTASGDIKGISTVYHATNIARWIVAESRLPSYEFELRPFSYLLEPADIIRIKDDLLQIDEYVKIEKIEVQPNFTTKVSAVKYELSTYTWSMMDDEVVRPKINLDFTVGTPQNLMAVYLNESGRIRITWDADDDQDVAVNEYEIASSRDGEEFSTLAYTFSREYFHYPRLAGEYRYKVRAITTDNRRSDFTEAVSIPQEEFAVEEPVIVSVEEEQYVTVNNSTVKARLQVEWMSDTSDENQFLLQWRVQGTENYESSGYIDSLNYTILDVQNAIYEIRVKAVNPLLVSSDWNMFVKTVDGLLTSPNNIQNFAIVNINGNAHLSWDVPEELDVRFAGNIEIKHTRDTVNPSWANALQLIPSVAGNSDHTTTPLISGTYLIKAIDSSGVESPIATPFRVILPEIIPFNRLLTITESPSFSGEKINVEVINNRLSIEELSSSDPNVRLFATEGTYTFSSIVDLNRIVNAHVGVEVEIQGETLSDTIDARVTLIDTWDDFDGVTAARVSVFCEVRHTQDDPDSDTASWSNWERFIVSDYQARGFQFRIQLRNGIETNRISITRLAVTIDVPDAIQSGNTMSTTLADQQVTFQKEFNVAPTVTASIMGNTTGAYVSLTSVNQSSFRFGVFEMDGTRIERTISWIARGY